MREEEERFHCHGTLNFFTVELFGIIHEFCMLSRFCGFTVITKSSQNFRVEFESPITIMLQIGRQSIDDQSVEQILNTR